MTLDNETEVIEQPTEEVEEIAAVEEEQVEGQEGADAEGEQQPEAEADEVVVTIGDDPAPEEEEIPATAAPWIKDLRKRNQETVKENRELKKKLEALQAAPADKLVTIGEKPTLESCEYDTDKFEQELEQWHEAKRKVSEQERKKQEAGAKAQAAWQATLESYSKRKSELKVSDYEEAEFAAQEVLSVTQQGVILSGADNPALVVYALGKNPKKAQELAAISDPVKFAFAVAKLEKDMKVTPRKTAPLPESTVRGNARVSAGVDSTLERLRAEADRTGDRTKVASYMKQQQAAKKRA
jgi:hypothetical protein